MTTDANQDEDFIASITPDVMRSLTTKGFFAALDDVLSPVDEAAAPVACRGDYENAKRILLGLGFDAVALDEILEVLMNRGGFCDCEILYNTAEASRLKAKYWRAQVNGGSSSLTHHGGNKK
jgi:hypothetical protein